MKLKLLAARLQAKGLARAALFLRDLGDISPLDLVDNLSRGPLEEHLS